MDSDTATDMPHIGTRLREAREQDGMSHAQISDILRIQANYLEAIEKLDTAALPSIGYVLGYVRAYANYLGLDGKEAVESYKIDSQIPDNLGRRNTPHFVPKREIRMPRGFFAATTVVSCAAVLAFWYGSQTDAQSAILTAPAGFGPTDAPAPVQVEIDPDLMSIKAIAPSWVKVKDKDGNTLISRILVAGESYQTDVDSGVLLSARDSGALELFIGGERIGSLGRQGIPMTDIPMPAIPRLNMDTEREELEAAEAAALAAQAEAKAAQEADPKTDSDTETPDAPKPKQL